MAPEEFFPVIDFANFDTHPEQTAKELFRAARHWGFLILKGHGIPQEDIDHMFSLSKEFFQQPLEIKSEKWMNTMQIGYDNKESVIGVQEAFCFGDVAGKCITSENISSWWDKQKRIDAEAFRSRCYTLSVKLMECFAISMGLPANFFSQAHQTDKAPGNVLRLIKYPALSEQPDAAIPRLGEHTDWGTLTLLFAKTPGLEVRSPDRGWVAAPVVPSAVIVNIADGLALWSGKTLKSTLHRLSWESLPYHMDRFSMAYFVNANADAPLKFLKKNETEDSFSQADVSFDATFGDYQAVRMRIIHEKFDSDFAGKGPALNPKFVNLVKNLGVAHGTGITFDGAEVGN